MDIGTTEIDLPERNARGCCLIDNVEHRGSLTVAGRGATLSREGESGGHVMLLVAGYAVAAKQTERGSLQNVALFVPGDVVDHESFTLGLSCSTAMTLTPVRFARIRHLDLRDRLIENSSFAAAFWRNIAFQGALAREWVLNLGQRTAYVRCAHFFCELIYRSQFVAGQPVQSCEMPLTQTELASTLGLSVVHINRTLQRLRQEAIIHLRRNRLDVLDWERLRKVAGFQSAYLDLGE